MDQAGGFAGGARGVVDVAVDVEHVERAVARQALAFSFGDLDGIGGAQPTRAGARRIVGQPVPVMGAATIACL